MYTFGKGSSSLYSWDEMNFEQVTTKLCCFPLDSLWPMMIPVHYDLFDPSANIDTKFIIS
jgi:hypothetical protein